jgi:hypothetical protein
MYLKLWNNDWLQTNKCLIIILFVAQIGNVGSNSLSLLSEMSAQNQFIITVVYMKYFKISGLFKSKDGICCRIFYMN